MSIDRAAAVKRFTRVTPATARQIEDLAKTQELFTQFAAMLALTLPEGREKSLAFTSLEEASHWASRAVVLGDQ